MRSLISVSVALLLFASSAWARGQWPVKSSEAAATLPAAAAVAPGILYPPLPTNMSLPTYDYGAPETCAGCHFVLGLDHTARVLGVIWNDTTQTWQLTGSGWLASAHAQSDHGSTENGFCAKCHSPLQASASAGFNNGTVVNAGAIPQLRFQAVTCATCHPPDNITAQIGALNPDAIDGGAIAIYLWKGYNNPASYQTLNPGVNADGTSKEDLLCLNCHEQRHNTDDTAFEAMYTTTFGPGGGPVRCIDCHMSTYQSIGGGNTGLPLLEERFHDWKVGANLPYSCGAQGSVSGCHSNQFSQFTVADAQNIIPFIREQHMEWWTLPPFNGEPQVAMTAHGKPTLAEYKVLWQEISKIDGM
jgi:hypothetical protein